MTMRLCGSLLFVVLLTVAVQAKKSSEKNPEDDFACYKCKKAYHDEQCNAQGIDYCKSKERACVTIEEVQKDGSIETEKKCIDPTSKYCREMPYCKGKDDDKCYYCCYDTLCNSANPQPKDPCECKPCLNGGTCTADDDTSFTCQCTADYTGSYCENLADREDPCDSDPCQNSGTCRSIGDDVNCDCPPAYSGQYCESAIDPCQPDNPCMNDGTCWASGDSFRCECKAGFSGERCEKEDHPCASNPCKNGGTCTSHCTGYTCLCRPGFTGKNCESPAEGCLRCPTEFGLYADPYNCDQFYHCSHYVPYHKSCPHPLHFNDDLKVCDWPEHAKCIPTTMTEDQRHSWDVMTCECLIDQTDPEDDTGGSKREVAQDDDGDVPEPNEDHLQEMLDRLSDVINDIDQELGKGE